MAEGDLFNNLFKPVHLSKMVTYTTYVLSCLLFPSLFPAVIVEAYDYWQLNTRFARR